MSEMIEFVQILSLNMGETQTRSPVWLHIFNKAQNSLLTLHFAFALCRLIHTCIKLLSPVLLILLWTSAMYVKVLEKDAADMLEI